MSPDVTLLQKKRNDEFLLRNKIKLEKAITKSPSPRGAFVGADATNLSVVHFFIYFRPYGNYGLFCVSVYRYFVPNGTWIVVRP